MSRQERRHANNAKKTNWKLWIFLIIVIVVIASAVIYRNTRGTGVDYTEYNYTDDAYDKPDANHTLEEFSDFQCPACQATSAVARAFREVAPDDVRFVYRHFPLRSIHPLAQGAAEASECAREQNKFWAYHDVLFESTKLSPSDLKGHAEGLGLDMNAWEECLDTGRGRNAVQRDYVEGTQRNVRGTPTFFADGTVYNGGRSVTELLNQFK